MLQDSTSQAIAGSSSVGSLWNVTVSVPPALGPLALGLLLELVELPQAAKLATSASIKASAMMATAILRVFMSAPLLLPVVGRVKLVHWMQVEAAGGGGAHRRLHRRVHRGVRRLIEDVGLQLVELGEARRRIGDGLRLGVHLLGRRVPPEARVHPARHRRALAEQRHEPVHGVREVHPPAEAADGTLPGSPW